MDNEHNPPQPLLKCGLTKSPGSFRTQEGESEKGQTVGSERCHPLHKFEPHSWERILLVSLSAAECWVILHLDGLWFLNHPPPFFFEALLSTWDVLMLMCANVAAQHIRKELFGKSPKECVDSTREVRAQRLDHS